MAASTNTFAESHKRSLTLVFTLKIVDTVNFYHKDRALKYTAKWYTFPSLLISIQHDTGADAGRNLTRAQHKDRGRGYMGVENIPEL